MAGITGRDAKGRITSSTGKERRYKTAAELEAAINKYFDDCDGYMIPDAAGNPKLDKWGEPIRIGVKPYTMTGLALAIGFDSRHSLLNYKDYINEIVDVPECVKGSKEAEKTDNNEENRPYLATITRARARVEEYAERRLYDKDGANGAKFSLANNFRDWKESREIGFDAEKPFTIDVTIRDK